jgi:hypothetical protein
MSINVLSAWSDPSIASTFASFNAETRAFPAPLVFSSESLATFTVTASTAPTKKPSGLTNVQCAAAINASLPMRFAKLVGSGLVQYVCIVNRCPANGTNCLPIEAICSFDNVRSASFFSAVVARFVRASIIASSPIWPTITPTRTTAANQIPSKLCSKCFSVGISSTPTSPNNPSNSNISPIRLSVSGEAIARNKSLIKNPSEPVLAFATLAKS